MKASLLITLIALTATLSMSAHAIPPSPPTFLPLESSVIVCNNLKSFNFVDLIELPNLKIISYDIFTNTICKTGK